ncbi:MAG: translation initiation factor IF-3 [Candidatus Levybacteria bacterium RIFCSPHIGHO2_01_FULL_37_17]|nr:MAG: translation initiation factor IF-3 [Candidatus Levybacteria bacterium RIFCSPHIGHO2_01_FULL_37_17]OGH36771.1 MAG: translation initiation factor IF-3 [Candidatus Levybacteria bacterium RIFCSPLOWO2_01_FULL_38_23]
MIDAQGKQIGVMTKVAALALAKQNLSDLVEIAPRANPPVAKIINYKKFLYQEEKKKREEKRKTKSTETKEVRLGPFMSENDLAVMTKRTRDFLQDGNKVRLVVYFSGRQITHPEFGHKVLDGVIEKLSDTSKVDREKRLEGRKLITVLSPEKQKSNEKENKKISS